MYLTWREDRLLPSKNIAQEEESYEAYTSHLAEY